MNLARRALDRLRKIWHFIDINASFYPIYDYLNSIGKALLTA